MSFLAVFLLLFCLQLLCSLNKPTQLVLLCQDLEKVEYEGDIVGLAPYVVSTPPLELRSLLMQGLLYPAKSGMSALQVALDVASLVVRSMQAEVCYFRPSAFTKRDRSLLSAIKRDMRPLAHQEKTILLAYGQSEEAPPSYEKIGTLCTGPGDCLTAECRSVCCCYAELCRLQSLSPCWLALHCEPH